MGYKSAIILLVLAVYAQNAESIRCWSCSSDVNPACADYFNTTALQRRSSYDERRDVPTLMDCDRDRFPNAFNLNQRSVCLKKIQTTYGRKAYIRQCHILTGNEQIGRCPMETTSGSVTVDFCEYCDTEGCNGANALNKNAIATSLLPIALYYYLRQ